MTHQRVQYITGFVLIAVLVWIASCSRPSETPIRQAAAGITLKRKLALKGMDLFLLIDESGSMYGDNGTDPEGLRYEAGKYLVQNLLVKETDPDFPHRISIVHFGDLALSHPLTDLIPTNAEELARRIPHTGS